MIAEESVRVETWCSCRVLVDLWQDIFLSVISIFAFLRDFHVCIVASKKKFVASIWQPAKILVTVSGIAAYDVPFLSSDDSQVIIRVIANN